MITLRPASERGPARAVGKDWGSKSAKHPYQFEEMDCQILAPAAARSGAKDRREAPRQRASSGLPTEVSAPLAPVGLRVHPSAAAPAGAAPRRLGGAPQAQLLPPLRRLRPPRGQRPPWAARGGPPRRGRG